MKKIATSDLMSPQAYAAERPTIRQVMMDHKKTRRVQLGPNATLHFEDYMTMRYQILETIRVEKISDEAELKEELETYNPLIPDGQNLKATFMLEFPDEQERRQKLSELIGIEEKVTITIDGFEPVKPVANEDLKRTTENKTSAVHFLRFEFSPDMIAASKAGASWSLRCDHENYRHEVKHLDETIRQSLNRDFDR